MYWFRCIFSTEVSQVVLSMSFPFKSWQRLNKSTKLSKSWKYIFSGLQVRNAVVDAVLWERRRLYDFYLAEYHKHVSHHKSEHDTLKKSGRVNLKLSDNEGFFWCWFWWFGFGLGFYFVSIFWREVLIRCVIFLRKVDFSSLPLGSSKAGWHLTAGPPVTFFDSLFCKLSKRTGTGLSQ